MPLSDFPSEQRRHFAKCPRAVVAIPAKNEGDHLQACLFALTEQVDLRGRSLPRDAFRVVVLANNCSDDTVQIARRMALSAPFDLRVIERRLPPSLSHAGGARRVAMDFAASWLGESFAFDGLILTTDADSRVAPDWICTNMSAFAQAADAVLGHISLDEEAQRFPAALHARGKLEAVYEDLLTEISARLDPQVGNPWPHHSTISGATLAVTRRVYLRIGGLPCVPLGEDKALVAELRRHDAVIRFAPDVTVVTSGRLTGRAAGGVADTLRYRSVTPDALCDEALEKAPTSFRRALWRGRLRRGDANGNDHWQEVLKLPRGVVRRAQSAATFGAAWQMIEEASPALARVRIAPGELPFQIERATKLLRRLQERLPAGEDIEPVFKPLVAADNSGELT